MFRKLIQTTAKSTLTRPSRLGVEPLEGRLMLDSTVVFNEIMYNPAGETDDSLEWIELYNQLAVDMDVSEWTIQGGIDYTFPDGTAVPGRETVVVAISPAALQAATGFAGALGPFQGRLSNGGEELRLINNDGRVMNVVEYGDRGEWPVGPDGSGVSLVKRDPATASDPAENWTSSSQINGTPGSLGNGANEITLISDGADWKYLDDGTNQGTAWRQPAFLDDGWEEDRAQLGYGDGDEATVVDYGPDPDNKYVTTYFRHTFPAGGTAQLDELTVELLRDDGAVVYINGQEATRSNMPGGTVGYLTLASSMVTGAAEDTFYPLAANPGLLADGENLIAVELHQAEVDSRDISFDLRLKAKGSQLRSAVKINEVAPASAADFWLELVNSGGVEVDLAGMVLTATGAAGGRYVFPARTIPPGGFLQVTQAELGLHPRSGEKLFLYSPGEDRLFDARVVTNRLRGRSQQHDGRWLYPDVPTPGEANSFAFHDEIVINEIMYHAYPQLATDEQPFQESAEQWIELYNRGTTAVDLDGWVIEDAVDYEFPPGVSLEAGRYLVVARDAAALELKHPGIDIVGDFSRSLNNHDDRILLLDANENPADEVHYYQSGRWPAYADGGGSSLELRNPAADNSQAETWAASDEKGKSVWTTYSFSKTSREPLDVSTVYNEFIFGLLDGGEFLIDNISVKRGGTTEMIQNGTFTADAIGSAPATWRLIGNHSGVVEADPLNAANRVLHVTAAGPQQHVHDHAETTFVGNTAISDGTQYVISFRTKWMAGNGQLNNRLYFTRVGNTAHLQVPEDNGTPGAENSRYQPNLGPTFSDFGHSPVLPSAGQTVTVSVRAKDPDGVLAMTLWWNSNGGAWSPVAMTSAGGGLYTGAIPGQSSGSIVQFCVEGQDGPGALAAYPAGGRVSSRALYQVNDGRGTSRPIDVFRLVMLPADNSRLFSGVNKMSNNYAGGTMIYNGAQAFYDVGIRQIGSRFIRPNSGFKVRLNPDQPFYGVHDSLRFDINGLKEIYMKQMVNRAGGSSVSMYDDVSYLISQRHTRTMLMQMARYEDVFLNEQFANGGEGTKWELDDITYPTNPSPSPEGLKTGTGVSSPDMNNRGGDKEAYRGHLLIKNQRAKDDYSGIIAMSEAIHRSGQALDEATEAVLDVDLWMRHYATQAFLGNWDTYGFRRPKNLRIYVRPQDQKVIPLFWDADLANLTESLIYNGGRSRLDEIRDRPQNLRLFWGHMWDLIDRAFNATYIASWASHYGSLTGEGYGGEVNKVANRASQARSQARSAIPQVAFSITTNGGNNFTVNTPVVTIEGNGWIDVRRVELAGRPIQPLLTWTGTRTWRMEVPLLPGPNVLGFQAVGFRGNTVASDSITVTNTVPDRDLQEMLRITEINYNPHDPTPDEAAAGFTNNDDFEFIELVNIGDQTIDLGGAQFTQGVEMEFVGIYEGPPVLITEAGPDDPDFVEIQNISGRPIHTAGWFVVVNNATDIGHPADVGAFHATVWQLPDAMAADEVLFRSDVDDGQGNYWGENIFWRTLGPGWAMLVDDGGRVADFAVWGYSQDQIDSLQIDVGGFQGITVGDAWNGPAVPANDSNSKSLQRIVEGDRDEASDFSFIAPHSRGQTNPNLTVPFPPGPFELAPGQLTVITPNPLALEARYGTGINFGGQYQRQLSNGGEQITLLDKWGRVVLDFTYGDSTAAGWPGRADGKGASLELLDPAALPDADPQRTAYLSHPANWRSSGEYGGSPGVIGAGLLGDVLVNEVLSHPRSPGLEAIELHNTTGEAIDVGGWYLSDSWGWQTDPNNGDYKKFRIPEGTRIPAGGYLVFDENDFNPDGGVDPLDFSLDEYSGGDLWLMQGDAAGRLTRFVDHVEFGAAAEGESWGRLAENDTPNQTDLYPMQRVTIGGENSGPRVGPALISELHYNPDSGLADDDLEFVEIYNNTSAAVDLTDWRIRGGIEYDFPTGATLGARSALVVVPFELTDAAKLAAFRARHDIDESVELSGGYTDRLGDTGERVTLQRPGEEDPSRPGSIARLLEDEVRYSSKEPWPLPADGGNRSLQRLGPGTWGSSATSWTALPPTPGVRFPWPEGYVVGRHVFYNNSTFDGNDPAAGPGDDAAIAPDKTALLPGGTATFSNYTGYSAGINGVMIDVVGLPPGAALTADDFQFRVGNDIGPALWPEAPVPTQITVRPGEGVDGSDRVTLVWPDNTIQKQWLEVTVLVTDETGLDQPDVSYFGNAIGETGDSATDAKVNVIDMLGARDNQRNFLDPAPIDFPFDFNRDARVNSVDMLIARNNTTHFLNALRLITVPPAAKDAVPPAAKDAVPPAAKDAVPGGKADEVPGGRLDWLADFDRFDTDSPSAQKDRTAPQAVDQIFATE